MKEKTLENIFLFIILTLTMIINRFIDIENDIFVYLIFCEIIIIFSINLMFVIRGIFFLLNKIIMVFNRITQIFTSDKLLFKIIRLVILNLIFVVILIQVFFYKQINLSSNMNTIIIISWLLTNSLIIMTQVLVHNTQNYLTENIKDKKKEKKLKAQIYKDSKFMKKNFVLMLMLVFYLFSWILLLYISEHSKKPYVWCVLTLASFIYFIGTAALRLIITYIIALINDLKVESTDNDRKEEKKSIFYKNRFKNEGWSKVIGYCLSFDYLMSYLSKRILEYYFVINNKKYYETKKGYTQLLKVNNYINIIVSGIIVSSWLFLFKDNDVIKAIIMFRVISRSIEIIIAFYEDVIEMGKKSSFLNGVDRIKLALRSLLEISILYTGLYVVLDVESGDIAANFIGSYS